MLPLTTHLLTFNNENTIEESLDALLPLGGYILVGDLGSTDQTIACCEKRHLRVMRLSLNNDRSQARNHLLKQSKTDWNLWVDPWELLYGHGVIKKVVTGGPAAYRMNVISGDVLVKQTRLWHRKTKKTFVNPVYETLSPEDGQFLNGAGLASDGLVTYPKTDELLAIWQSKSPVAEAFYYQACSLLARRQYTEFLNVANHYLFMGNTTLVPVTMTRYYIATVAAYIQKDADTAIKYTTACLAANPLMAEFWCLLGDTFYWCLKQYDKAAEFYENALLLGTRRLKDDNWPMQISKYDEHPKKMLKSCKDIMAEAHWVVEAR